MKSPISKHAKIVFLGMPGAGKSTYGRAYAKKFDMCFFDLDVLIETRIQSTIHDYIQSQGVEAFRKIENSCLENFLIQNKEKKHWVLSTGGGTPCFFNHMSLINHYAFSIYISVNVSIIKKDYQLIVK